MLHWRSLRYRFWLLAVIVGLFLLNNYFINKSASIDDAQREKSKDQNPEHRCDAKCGPSVKEQSCVVDGGKPLKCWKDDIDVYFPVAFVRKRFDMSGKFSKDGKNFELYTSYSKIRVPENAYDPLGAFGHFSTYSVETRDRVRCISAKTDVPMSTQWDPNPYYYPIQIAQYGLQHYSRMKNDNETLEPITQGRMNSEWKGAAGMHETTERLFYHHEEKGAVVNVTASATLANSGAYVYLDKTPQMHVVSFEWLPVVNASFTFLVKLKENNLLVLLNYVFASNETRCVWSDDDGASKRTGQVSFSYSLGEELLEWRRISRDVLVDTSRALSSGNGRKKDENIILHPGDVFLVSIGFRGQVTIKKEIVQTSEHHRSAFVASADWLVASQDDQGGWPVPVERAIADRRLVLPPGWHSAMAQGHGLSVLTRAYHEVGDVKYLTAATKALKLFSLSAERGGVMNEIFGVPWYEEYPTTPGSFVLNGFLYALIGLYDFSRLPNDASQSLAESAGEARKLYEAGVSSLKKILPLYDTGSGSIYDLRHVGLNTAPNLARWDYHAVHVYLLKWIADLEKDSQLDETVKRWIGYAYGKKARHN